MRVALVSDTHLPAEGSLPGWIEAELRAADHVVHAGDFITPRAHFELRVLAGGGMTAVRGNRDRGIELPSVATVECDGVRFVVTHGDGYGRGERYRRALADLARERDADVVVAGHTHLALDTRYDGVRLLNPGSATGAPPADGPTLMTVDCSAGEATVTRHEEGLDERS